MPSAGVSAPVDAPGHNGFCIRLTEDGRVGARLRIDWHDGSDTVQHYEGERGAERKVRSVRSVRSGGLVKHYAGEVSAPSGLFTAHRK